MYVETFANLDISCFQANLPLRIDSAREIAPENVIFMLSGEDSIRRYLKPIPSIAPDSSVI